MACDNNPATRVSENRFLQSFFAVSASAVLVSGTLLLLSSTAPWAPPQLADGDPSTPDAAHVAPEAAGIDIDVSGNAVASDQDDSQDNTEFQAQAEAEIEAPGEAVVAEANSPEIEAVAALGTPLSPESADASLDVSIADAPIAVLAEASSVHGATSDTPAEVAVSVPLAEIADLRRDAATDQIAEMLSGLPPRPITSDKSEDAISEVATALAAEPSAPPPPPTSDTPAESKDHKLAPIAVVQPITPRPPLPKRKPDVQVLATARPSAPQAVATAKPEPIKPQVAKQDSTKQEPATQGSTQPRGGLWQAMTLAPADKPALKVPTARPSNAAHGRQVWAALARHKPRAGVRGSATVVFSIGEYGALRGVKIGRSSGNTRIDQLALQTVRSAAPYPAPPSGAATYTIRIDFQ